ncbi:hypothetical protein HPP92_028340 [Vanilla planifolia]|uniref:Protein kinase domain-containing protein n=1 Tax=Vanilla planifolia TaxID=51239 RepID=A0A835U4D3_VANPL|nr:hypothetical protein HPP92_028340 [Vanilla planifolia]KAG0447484.1 hypothetical protein HPP92_028313 [Vanilla planifolia]
MKSNEEETKRPAGENAGEAGKTIVVGMKMDAEGKELLTWALVKVAHAGDRVIAVLVLPSAAEVADSEGLPSSLISLMKDFDALLSIYKGFCDLKQIDLKLKVRRGNSVRRILVEEASSVSCSKLVVGVNKNLIGSLSTYIAKYCVKKLPPGCMVLAVGNGKIMFQKESNGVKSVDDAPPRSDSMSFSKVNALAEPGNNTSLTSPCLQHLHTEMSICHINDGNETKISISSNSFETIEEAAFNSPCNSFAGRNDTSSVAENENTLAAIPEEGQGPFGFVSILMGESLLGRQRFSLLRQSFLYKGKATLLRSKSSVYQWAMRIPIWNTVSSFVHPYSKDPKSDEPAKFDFKYNFNDNDKKLFKELLSLKDKYSSVCRLFSYEELLQGTSNYSPDNIIGKGGSGMVYKACQYNGKELAVKILKPSPDVLKDFISEIEIITKLQHKNITSLYGFCFEENTLVLVYDLLSKGSLDDNLHGLKGIKNELGWAKRFKIALGVAEALDYLHSDGEKKSVIHRDVKSSNILLSDEFEPQLSDFGLAQWASSSNQFIENMDCGDLAGTVGYLAPEYFIYGRIDEKIDIYAFGVVLLELISGRRPVSTGCPKVEENLANWAKPILVSGKFELLVDPLLGDNYVAEEMERLCLAAGLCIRYSYQSRPTAALVLQLLRGESDVVAWARSDLSAHTRTASDDLDYESILLTSNIQSHIDLALLDVEDDALSSSSVDEAVSFTAGHTALEDYLKARCKSRSPSLD